jgi:hypothetical protein
MKKVLFGVLAVVVLVFGLTAGTVFAAEAQAPASTTGPGPFEGIFYGTVTGDNNSRAPIAMQMTHRNEVVSGRLYIGEGLHVNAGVCGNTTIPSMVQSASGRTLPDNPNKLTASTTFNVSGFNIGVNLNSTVSADGGILNATTTIDLPWICGSDRTYSGTLYRIK